MKYGGHPSYNWTAWILMILPHIQQEMQDKTNIAVKHSAGIGLNIHGKSKIFKVKNKKPTIRWD